MSIPLGIALYIVIWWTLLFAVLPIARGETQGEKGEVVPGTPESAPARLRMVRVVLITSVAAAIVFVIVAWAMDRYLVPYVPTGPGAG